MNDYIDYSEDTDTSEDKWTHTSFKKYFKQTFFKTHKAGGGIPWTVKETVLLKTMMKEYKPQELADLILYWHINRPRTSVACSFCNFYNSRTVLYEKMKKDQDEFTWS